jgi:ankyrin repeat protein
MMPNPSAPPPIEFIRNSRGRFNFGFVTEIKVNITNLSIFIKALESKQSLKNMYNQIAENDDEIDFLERVFNSRNRGSSDDIEASQRSTREIIIARAKEDISLLIIIPNRNANLGNSEFRLIQPSQVRDYLNPKLVELARMTGSQLTIINLGLENFKDEQNTRFFIDAFSQFSQEFQKSVIDLAIANSNFDFIDKFLEYKGDDPEYLLLSATRKNDTTKVHDILTSESSLPWYSLNLFRSTIRLGNLEMTEIILENQREFDTKLFFIGAIKAKNNKFETLNLFLSKITNFNEPIPDVDTSHIAPPIIFSIRKYDIKITNFLLEMGANIDIVANSETPLIVAIKMSNIKIIELLLDKGAEIDKRPAENGDTPLIYAIRKGKADIAKLLLDRGANFDKLDSLGLSAIHIATRENNFIMVRLLVEKNKGSVNFVVSKGEFEKFTPLHFATLNNNPEMVEFLLNNKAKTEKITKSDKTALHIAVENDNTSIVQLLLAKEVDKINLNSLLHIVIEKNNTEILKLFLEKGANPNIARSDGLTPIVIAITNYKDDLLSILLESKKLDINSLIQNGKYANYSIVDIACACGNAKALGQLLDIGNSKTRDFLHRASPVGLYPIHHAIESLDLETIKLLLEKGANSDQKTQDGLTSLDIAINVKEDKNKKGIIKFLGEVNKKKKNGNSFDLDYAIINLSNSEVRKLLKKYEDVNKFSRSGFAPLHIACDFNEDKSEIDCRESIEIIKIILEKGADIDIEVTGKSHKDFTPLYIAILNGNTPVVKFLLDQKADVNKVVFNTNFIPLTPLAYAIVHNNSAEMLSCLLEKGAEIIVSDKRLDDYYIFAVIKENQTEIARFLLKNLQENDSSFDYSSLLHFAVSQNKINIVQILLENEDIPINALNSKGQTVLHVAILNQSTQILKELLKSEKIDLDAIDKGFNPIAIAQFIHYDEGERLLIEEWNRRDELNKQFASIEDLNEGDSEGKKVYEEIRKISKSLRDSDGELAISPPSLINLLRKNPEEIFLPQNEKNSATIFQFVATHPECINLLKDILNSIKSSSSIYLINEDWAMAKNKSTGRISVPPLYSAISFGNLEGARSLIEAGAEINFRITSNQYSLLEVLLRNLKKLEDSPESTIANSKKVETIFAMTSLLTGDNKRSARVLFSDEESQKIIKYLDKIPSQKEKILNILQKNYPENKFFQEARISEPDHKVVSRFEELSLDGKKREIEVARPAPNSNARLVTNENRDTSDRLDQAKTRFNST